MGEEIGKRSEISSSLVLKLTQSLDILFLCAAAANNCAFCTQHLPPPMMYRLIGHDMASNLRGYLPPCSGSARCQV